jgi:hypothetical protein
MGNIRDMASGAFRFAPARGIYPQQIGAVFDTGALGGVRESQHQRIAVHHTGDHCHLGLKDKRMGRWQPGPEHQ